MSVKRSPPSPRRFDQEAEDVAAAAVGGGAAAADLLVDDRVEDRPRAHHLPPRRARPAHQADRVVGAVVAERLLEVVGGRGPLARLVRVEAEQRPHRDPHRQPAHPDVDVDHGAGPQGGDRRRRLGLHRRGRGLDLLAVEGGQHDRPGAVVVGVVDRQQAVAEQRDQVAEARLAPVELLRVADGDEVVGLRAEHEDRADVEQSQAEDRPELFVGVEQDRQRVARHLHRPRDVEVGQARRVHAPPPPLRGEVAADADERVAGHHRRALDRAARIDRCHGRGS